MAAMQTTTRATSSLILSIILIITLTSLNIDAKELGNDCEVKIPPNIAIAILAKPDTVGDIWFVSMFLLYGIEIIKAIQRRYEFILLEAIKLTKILRPNLVQSKYGEEFINAKLFKTIVNHNFPLRNEIVFVVRISLKSRDSQKITKYGCRADDNNSNQFSYSFNHSYYHTDITKHRCEGTRQ
ncbi:Hypothetical predicted protein [Octopus vulgaris]|uniref:Uncharacterized protein n=1 Tax=Octopus vulgaris TaxID=6645 RepID=A0AA36AJK7_OCTVU|nr:Hypothetical predicted protein [Octopus vulgaris]